MCSLFKLLSGGQDYSLTSVKLEFQPSTNPMACISDVMILQDARLEGLETFVLLLESSDLSVNINSQLNISIEDNNSKLTIRALESYSNIAVSATAVHAGFQSTTYVGMESLGNLTVCASINSDVLLDREVSVKLITVSGSADGNIVTDTLGIGTLVDKHYLSYTEEDYIPLEVTLTFTPGSSINSEVCQEIIIINDGIRAEVSEELSVTLTTLDTDVILEPNIAQILIYDNDSGCITLSNILRNFFMLDYFVIQPFLLSLAKATTRLRKETMLVFVWQSWAIVIKQCK